MRRMKFSGRTIKPILIMGFIIAGCKGDYGLDIVQTQSIYSGNLVITSVTTDPGTGPGLVSMYDSEGTLVSILQDLFSTGTNFGTGVDFIPPNKVIAAIEGNDALHEIDLGAATIRTITNTNLASGPLRQLTRSTVDGSIYIVEANPAQVEKFTSDYQRVGNPFIGATTGSCALATPYGIAFIPTVEYIAVVSSAVSGRLSIYDKDGNCIRHQTTAPMNAGTPSGITYHSLSNKLVITRATDHSIWSMNIDGTNPFQIYLNSTIINTPRAITSDADGYLYVSSSGTDTVEKLYYSGTGTASRALPGPLVGPSVHAQNVSSILVVP